jgi:hypothetical protein
MHTDEATGLLLVEAKQIIVFGSQIVRFCTKPARTGGSSPPLCRSLGLYEPDLSENEGGIFLSVDRFWNFVFLLMMHHQHWPLIIVAVFP